MRAEPPVKSRTNFTRDERAPLKRHAIFAWRKRQACTRQPWCLWLPEMRLRIASQLRYNLDAAHAGAARVDQRSL